MRFDLCLPNATGEAKSASGVAGDPKLLATSPEANE